MDARAKYFTTAQEGFEFVTSQACVAEIDRILNEIRKRSGAALPGDVPNTPTERRLGFERRARTGSLGAFDADFPFENPIRLDPVEYFESGYDVLSTHVHERIEARGFRTFQNVVLHTRKNGEIFEPDFPCEDSDDCETKIFQDFNEGVAELIAEEVYRELVTVFGASKFVNRHSKKGRAWYAGNEWPTHEKEKAEVKAYLENYSKTYEIPRSAVWEAVKRGYFEGLDLFEIFDSLSEEWYDGGENEFL